MKGNFANTTATQLFNLIHLAKRSGSLSIIGESAARVVFQDGRVIYANLESTGRDLAQILWQNGKLTSSQAQLIQAHAGERSERQLARLLVRAGYVAMREVTQSVHQYTFDVVAELLTWKKGKFVFRDGQPPADAIIISLDLENVIENGERHLREWELLQAELPDLGVRLRCSTRLAARPNNLQLTLSEWRVVTASNARETIKQIAEANRLTAFQIRQIVYGLQQVGLIEIVAAPQLT